MRKKAKINPDSLTPEQKKKYKRKRTAKIVTLSILGALLIAIIFNLFLLPLSYENPRIDPVTTYEGTNQYIKFTDKPLISAHRAGGDLAPEETLMAFKQCIAPTDYQVDIVEFDLHLTKDNELVLLHDATVDRTSNGVEHFGGKDIKVKDKTLSELKELNFGEFFVDPEGIAPYKGLRGDDIPDDVKIATLREVLTFLTAARPYDLHYIIEIKDGGITGERAMDKLYEQMVEFDIVEKTIVGTFKDNVTRYIDEHYPSLTRSASILEVSNFYYGFLYNLPPAVNCKVLQIPASLAWVHLDSRAVVDYAHKYGLAVQYWTINDSDLARKLIDYGADAIITDNPKTIYNVINN